MTASMRETFEDWEMDVRPIRTKRDYVAALKEAEALWDSRPGSPDPIELLLHVMESRALTRKDLEPYTSDRAHASYWCSIECGP